MMKKIVFIALAGLLLTALLGLVLAQNGVGDNACGTTKPIEECLHDDPVIQDFLFTCGYYQRQVQLGKFSINDPVVQDIQAQGCPFPETSKNKQESSGNTGNTSSGSGSSSSSQETTEDTTNPEEPPSVPTPMTTEEPTT